MQNEIPDEIMKAAQEAFSAAIANCRAPVMGDPPAVPIARAILAALTQAAEPVAWPILKGTGKINGDGWKDTTVKGEIVFVWNTELPSPYAAGQYPRISNEGWSASTSQYDFSPASFEEIRTLYTSPPVASPEPVMPEQLWALCYLHDWDPPKEGQEHKWEPGKNVFPEVHAFYRTWQEAEAVRHDMERSKEKYWVVRARPESETRQTKANLRLRPSLDDLMTENARLREALRIISERTSRCEHDGGFDREIGPIGCMLGDGCVCIGIHPIARSALARTTQEATNAE